MYYDWRETPYIRDIYMTARIPGSNKMHNCSCHGDALIEDVVPGIHVSDVRCPFSDEVVTWKAYVPVDLSKMTVQRCRRVVLEAYTVTTVTIPEDASAEDEDEAVRRGLHAAVDAHGFELHPLDPSA